MGKYIIRFTRPTSRSFSLALVLFIIFASSALLPSNALTPPIQQIDYSIERIWNGSSAKRIAISGDYLYLLNGTNKVILFEKDQEMAVFEFNESIYSIAALDRTLFFPQPGGMFAVSFENQSNPHIISKISHPLSMYWIISYKHYVYGSGGEMQFPIFDFSNLTNPKKVGFIWATKSSHATFVYRVSNFGLFIGDEGSSLFDLSTDPVDPVLLQAWDGYEYPFSFTQGNIWGIPAVSDQFFVVNLRTRKTWNTTRDEMFHILPRENETAFAPHFNIKYSSEKDYKHLALIHDNFLVASRANNTISILEITEDHNLSSLAEINLGDQGSVEDLYHIENTTTIYVADSSGGLIKLNLTLEFGSTDGSTIVFMEPLSLLATIVVLASFRRRRK